MNEKELHTNIRSALQSLTSNSPPSTIQQAQDALLQWEEQYTDDYVLVLLDLMGITSNETTSTKTTDAATLRLASILSLKATIVRRWKDRGRGKGPGGTPKPLMSENVKALVRSQILSLVLTGRVATHDSSVGTVTPFSGIEHIRHITLGQYEILSDHTLQMNAASLLAKIARMDLPLKFHDLIPTLVEGVKSSQSMISQLSQQHSDPSTHYELSQQRGLCLTIQQNAMTSLECVLAEISTQRLLVDKKYRYATAMQHLGRIVESGLIPSLAAMDSMKNELGRIDGMDKKEVQSIIFRINHAILSSRVVSHMLISSFSKLIEQNSPSSNVVDHTLTLIHTFFTQWLPFVTQNASNDVNTNSEIVAIKKLIKDLLHVLCELIVELQSSSPIPFVRYLDPFLSLFYSSLLESIWINHEEISFTPGRTYQMYQSKRILISSLLFLANVAETKQYTDICTDHNAATIVWKNFFTPNTILSLSRNLLVLISAHISPNKNTDNNDDDDEEGVLWQDDPEGFYQWENQRSTDEHVGCAAQNLFLALAEASFECEDGLQSPDGFHGGKDVILPWLVGLLTDLPSQRLAVELEAGIANANVQSLVSAMPLGASNSQGQLDTIKSDLILQWDAVYTVAGLACNYLTSFPGYDFNECFESLLGPLFVLLIKSENTTNHLLPILRRRIIWLISCNAHQVPVPSCHNPLELISISLSHNDICVRLTAVEAMEAILPYCEDSSKLLHSITHFSIAALYQLTNDCLEVDSRSSCLGLLSTLISFVGVLGGSLSNDVLNTVVSPLPSIWEDSIEQNLLLKRNVLNIISSVATLVGPDQASLLYPIALPMLDQSFGKEENIFLVQEALRMWLVFLRLSNGYNGSIGMLFTRAANLSKDLEHVIILMRISEYYIMLGGATFLNDHAQTIQEVLCNLVGEVRPRGLAYVGLVIEALLRSYPVESGSLLFQCGLVKRFSEACAGNYWEKDDCEPDRVIVLYLTALARILLSNLGMLSKILPVVSSFGEVFGEEQLVSMYISKFRAAGNGAHGLLFQKLWAILLASFFPPCEVSSVITNCVLSRSKEIFDGIFAYILRNVIADGSNLLSYDVGYDGEEEDIIDTGADRYELLLQEASKKDAIVAVPFKDFLESKLRSLPNSLGHEAYQQFLQMIGNDTMAELETLMGSR